MRAKHARSLKPLDIRDVNIACGLGALTTLLPLSALDKAADPLANAVLSIGGVWGAAIPLLVGSYLAVPLLIYVLRRVERRLQRLLCFASGILVGLFPFLFFAAAEVAELAASPLSTLALRGAISGSLLGLIAAWYIPRSTWSNIRESMD